MTLSWNEIRQRAIQFSHNWNDPQSERSEAQTFWNEFFEVFGISRRRVASFESRVHNESGGSGLIDLLWRGTLLVEHKSSGVDLDRAHQQALDYFPGLSDEELPQYIIVSNFQSFRLYNLDTGEEHEFSLQKLHEKIHLFDFIAGYKQREFVDEDPANIQAAEIMGKLHDNLKDAGYSGHHLEVFLVRILFCLFADDTGIFEKNLFFDFLIQRTAKDGSDLGVRLAQLFEVLNTPKKERQSTLDDQLNYFPYVNGLLFEERLPFASLDSQMRGDLIKSCVFNWSKISPEIFGAMFQSVMDLERRRNIGAHYTSEKNILKVVKGLFLDDLYEEFEKVKNDKRKLLEFHDKVAKLKFFDPACGCGNFLVVTYRELRLLELKILQQLYSRTEEITDIRLHIRVDVDSFYGIEIEEFPAMIAQVALWLVDHQMNILFSEEFGQFFARLPLKKSAAITCDNALTTNWKSVIDPKELNFMLGNPPFVGKQHRTTEQNRDMRNVWGNVSGVGVLDYVTCWYKKAVEYIRGTEIKVAFVSTNSISQGEQVGILWNYLLNTHQAKIFFAHRTFRWSSEASGMAHVHVVIVGFSLIKRIRKRLFEYEDVRGNPHEIEVKNINPYLVEGEDAVILARTNPISDVPKITFGNMPNDGGNLILNNEEKEELVEIEPGSAQYIRPLISAKEFLSNEKRWCIWIDEITRSQLDSLPRLKTRIEAVREYRLQSRREATRRLADFPYRFGEVRQPDGDYVLIPRHTSERREYIPIGFFTSAEIVHDSCSLIPNADIFIFGVLISKMHTAWVKHVCGRIKSDYRYSNKFVYNNYPFPKNTNGDKRDRVVQAAENVLSIRGEYENDSLASLYDPIHMPGRLRVAHRALDRAVDKCYRSQPFANERNRMEYLLNLYLEYLQPMNT